MILVWKTICGLCKSETTVRTASATKQASTSFTGSCANCGAAVLLLRSA